jgi:hypothetical protein
VLSGLFRDHSTGDAVSGVSGRIALHVIRFGVNHQPVPPLLNKVAVVAEVTSMFTTLNLAWPLAFP